MRHALTLPTLLLSLALPAHAAEVTLRASATVAGPRVTLAELATVDGDAGTLGALDLGPAPLPGYTTRLSRAQIERVLRARGTPHTLGGAPAVSIERLTQAADSTGASAEAERALRQRLQGAAARIELRATGGAQQLQLPKGRVEFKARDLGREAALQARVTVWVDVLVDAVFVRTVALQYEVQAFAPVLVARRDLAAGATPGCDSVEVREADLARLGGISAGTACAGVSGRLKRALAQGAPLLKHQLQAELAVNQGDSVALRVDDGAIVIEARATALSDGNVGQRIDVQPSAGTRAVRAEVVAPGLVKLTGK